MRRMMRFVNAAGEGRTALMAEAATGVWAGEVAAGDTNPTLPLVLLVGVASFAVGAFLAAQVAASVFRRRDEQLVQERQTLNRIWYVLREEFGIDKTAWMANALDRRRTRKRRGTDAEESRDED